MHLSLRRTGFVQVAGECFATNVVRYSYFANNTSQADSSITSFKVRKAGVMSYSFGPNNHYDFVLILFSSITKLCYDKKRLENQIQINLQRWRV